MDRFLKKAACCALLGLGLVFSTGGAAEAKQCVWNKGWFALRVQWYNQSDLVYLDDQLGLREGAKHVQWDEFPAAQGRCIDRGDTVYVAVLSVIGGEFAAGFAKGFIGTLTAVGGAAACVATGGTTCPVVVAGVTSVVSPALSAIPNGKEVFAITTPPTDVYVDVWGSVWDPQWAAVGGPIQ